MKTPPQSSKTLATNRKARHDYTILESYEAGMALLGSEVKSCLEGKASISEAYCVFRDGSLFLVHSSIAPYAPSSYLNHDQHRDRRLLLHKRQLRKIRSQVEKSGMTVIPLDIHVAPNGRIKLSIAVCRGKTHADKRNALRDRETKAIVAAASRR